MGVVFGLLMLACALGSLPSGMAQLPDTPEEMLETLQLCDQVFPESEASIQDLTNSASVVLKGEVIAVGRYNCQDGSVEADIAPPAGQPENPDALVAVECEYTNQGTTAALSTRSNEVIITGFGPRADCLSPAPAAESGVSYFFFVEPYDEPSADATLSQPEPALFCSGEEQPLPAFRLRYDAPSSAVVEAEPGDEALAEAEKRTVACAMATGEGAFSVSVSTSSPPVPGPQSSAATSESRAPGGAAGGQATASASPGGTTTTTTETTVTESGSSVTSVSSSSGGGTGSTTSTTSTSSSATNGLLAPVDSVGTLTSGDSDDSLLTGGTGLGVGSFGSIGSGSSSLLGAGTGTTSAALSTSTTTAAATGASPPAAEEAASPQPAAASSRAASSTAADNDKEEASARAPRAMARGRATAASSPASNGAGEARTAGTSPAAELRFPMAPSLELEDDSICGLPADPGPCEAYIPLWYFNDTEGRCRRFVYGGCLGNDNRFPSQAVCTESCELF